MIDVSSPGEKNVSIFYPAKKTANTNNKQTDVRQLWKLDNFTKVENTSTTNDNIYDANNSNNSFTLAKNITHVISPSSIINITSYPSNTTTESSLITTKTISQSQKLINIIEPITSAIDHRIKEQTQNIVSTTIESPSIVDKLITNEFTTKSSMSTSTDLITEVSVAFSNILSQINGLNKTTTQIPNENTILDTEMSKVSILSQTTNSISQESSTDVPNTSTVWLDNFENSSYTSDAINTITDDVDLRSDKKLDNIISEQPDVSNSLLDSTTTLFSNENETNKQAIAEIQINSEPIKTSQLELREQVKTIVINEVTEKSNSSDVNTVIPFDSLMNFDDDLLTTEQVPQNNTVEETTVTPTSLSINANKLLITKVPEITNSNFTQSSNSTNEMHSPLITINIINQENQGSLTTRTSELVDTIRDDNTMKSNKKVNSMDLEIKFYNPSSTNVPSGTEILSSTKDSFGSENEQSVLKKFLHSSLNGNSTFNNNFSNNTLMAELTKNYGNFSINSTNVNQFSSNIVESNVDSSTNELVQDLENFLDNTNKNPSVINDSTVESNTENLIVIPETHHVPITLLKNSSTNLLNIYTPMISISNNNFNEKTTIDALEASLQITANILNINNNLTNVTNSQSSNLSCMNDIFNKLLDVLIFQLENFTDLNPPIVKLLTKNPKESETEIKILVDDSSNVETTTTTVIYEHNIIIPTLLTHLQGSSQATAQRTAGINKQPNQKFSTLNPIINYPSSFAYSSKIVNEISIKDPKFPASAKTTTISTNNQALVPQKFSSMSKDAINNQPSSDYHENIGIAKPTPAPKFNSSFSTAKPLRDYLIYGIYPNKTIVRKRPEDNLNDPRNLDSPYVIFGLYPDGKLVRKFPNGTVIPDPPNDRVEVVFSPYTTTTTTNKPRSIYNQGMRKHNIYFNNTSNNSNPNVNDFFAPNEVDNSFSNNGPTGFDLPIASVSSIYETTVFHLSNITNIFNFFFLFFK